MVTMKCLARGMGVLALAAGLAACSSSSKPSSSKSSTSTATGGSTPSSAAATGSPIKLGMICSCSGPLGASVVGATDVFRAWMKTVNASGGLGGHPVELTYLDDGGSPGTSISDAQTLISDHVAAIMDLSLFDSAWVPTVAKAKIPMISGTQAPSDDSNAYVFPVGQTFASLFDAQASIAKTAGGTNMGVLICAEAASCQAEVPFIKAADRQAGIPLVYNASISATAPNYTAQCVAAQQAKVTVLSTQVSSTTVVAVSENCSQQGYHPIYIADSASYQPSMNSAPVGKNFWIDFSNLPYFATTPAVQAFNAALDRYYPGLREGKSSTQWNGQASQDWAAGLLIGDAVKGSGVPASGTVTAAALTKGLYSLKNDTLGGWAPPLTFTPGQPHSVNCWFAGKVVNGVTSVLNNAKPVCKGSSTP